MTAVPETWLLLIVSLPSAGATVRMRIWRAVKALGCAALRDGAYLLPAHAEQARHLRELADEATQEDGQAWLLQVQAHEPDESAAAAYRGLFDRTADYTDWLAELSAARRTLPGLAATELGRLYRRHARAYDAIRRVDFFPTRRPSARRRSGVTLPVPLKPSSRLASLMRPTAASPGATRPSTRAGCGRPAATCGSIVSPAPG